MPKHLVGNNNYPTFAPETNINNLKPTIMEELKNMRNGNFAVTKKVYLVHPFDKQKGIMTDTTVFGSVDAILKYYREGSCVITDEFERITNRDELINYIEGGRAIIKVQEPTPTSGLYDLLNLQPAEPQYYYISIENLIDLA